MEAHAEVRLKLPVNVISRIDVGRLVREVEELDNFLKQAAIREPGSPVKLPKTSRMLDEFISLNELNVLHEDDRKRLYMFLQTIKAKAPVLHMSFAADPSPRFLQRLMTWLRLNVDPMVLVQVGLQPNLGAGCMMRTTNKYFDLSLREYFKEHREVLVTKIHGTAEEAQKEAQAVQATQVKTEAAKETAEEQRLAQEVNQMVAAINPATHTPYQPPHPLPGGGEALPSAAPVQTGSGAADRKEGS